MAGDNKSASGWLILPGILWALLSPVCLGLSVFFVAFYDSPIDRQAGMGLIDYTLILSVLAFPVVCIIASLGIWILRKRSPGAATVAALLPLVPLIPVIAIFAWANAGSTVDLGNASAVSECIPPVIDGGDGRTTTGCGTLQSGIFGAGVFSTPAEAHNWNFSAASGHVRISVRNDGTACPHVMVLDPGGGIADGFEDENALRLCPDEMISTGFFEFYPPSPGEYILRVFSPETTGAYWVSIE